MVWLHGTFASLIKMNIVISRTYENNIDSNILDKSLNAKVKAILEL